MKRLHKKNDIEITQEGQLDKRYFDPVSLRGKWRHFLHCMKWEQPIEWRSGAERMQFELNTLQLWEREGFLVPKIVRYDANKLVLEYLEGVPLRDILNTKDAEKIVAKLCCETSYRHEKAIKLNQAALCHVDANMGNILVRDDLIYHLDFEMGRPWESPLKWARREISKMQISLLEAVAPDQRGRFLDLFKKYYVQQDVIAELKKSVYNKPFQSWHRQRALQKKLSNPQRVSLYDIV